MEPCPPGPSPNPSPDPKPNPNPNQELPFGIQPVAFLITSAIAVFLTVLFGYLFFLTSTN